SSSRIVKVSVPPSLRPTGGGGVSLSEVLLSETVQGGAALQDLGGDLAGNVLQQVLRDVGKVRVEVRVVRRDAHPVGADKPGRRFDLGLAPFDGGPAVAPEILAGRHGEVRRMRVAILGVVPFDTREEAGNPRVLGLEETDTQLRVELEHPA